jgi:hypothetical protein
VRQQADGHCLGYIHGLAEANNVVKAKLGQQCGACRAASGAEERGRGPRCLGQTVHQPKVDGPEPASAQ